MALILCIETSTEVCSVALVRDGVVEVIKEDTSGMNHSRLLTVFIDEIFDGEKYKVSDLDAVAVSEGPGSYTGLRIGVSAAKGLCYGAGIPMIAVSPLLCMAHAVAANAQQYGLENDDVLLPMIDARRMEVYTRKVNAAGNPEGNTEALVVDETAFLDVQQRLVYFGNGAAKCQDVFRDRNALFIDGITTSANNMAKPALAKFNQEEFVDVAYFEPFYLKNFIATTPKKNILG